MTREWTPADGKTALDFLKDTKRDTLIECRWRDGCADINIPIDRKTTKGVESHMADAILEKCEAWQTDLGRFVDVRDNYLILYTNLATSGRAVKTTTVDGGVVDLGSIVWLKVWE